MPLIADLQNPFHDQFISSFDFSFLSSPHPRAVIYPTPRVSKGLQFYSPGCFYPTPNLSGFVGAVREPPFQ
jgi:hypothetical protein